MQPLDPAAAALIAARTGLVLQSLIWIVAGNRSSGAVETMGLWSGDTDLMIDTGTGPRLYYGAGGLVQIEPPVAASGLEVRTLRVTFAIAPEVEMLVRGYDPRLGLAEVHRLVMNPVTRALAGTPQRTWKGWVDGCEITSGTEDEAGRIELTLASNAMAGTRGLALKKSDESQKLRLLPGGGADRFHRYCDVSGKVPVRWGEK